MCPLPFPKENTQGTTVKQSEGVRGAVCLGGQLLTDPA